MNRLSIRNRLLLAVMAAVAIALVGFVAGYNLILWHTLDRDARNLVRSRAGAQIEALRIRNGRVSVGEVPNDRSADAYVWVFAGHTAIEQPKVAPAIDRAVKGLVGGPPHFHDVAQTDTRLFAAPVVVRGKRLGTVVAGVSLAPYEETRNFALLASSVFGALVLIIVAVAARWLLGASLRPVARMTRQAAEWSEQDPGHRFALGPPHDEFTELASTLDSLLDRLAASLRHERRFSAELSHELRTPLARVLAESELALRRERSRDDYRHALELIRRNAEQLSRTVDALVAAARYEAGATRGTSDARAVAEGAAELLSGVAEERRLQLDVVDSGSNLRLGLDGDLAERILQPVLENACRYGAGVVRLTIARENSSIVYAIEDDGPGVAPGERERIFEPGFRGGAQPRQGDTGAGLGLALARRLALSVDGDIQADVAGDGGRFVIRLPAA
jgi:signal transduction histidine kinase